MNGQSSIADSRLLSPFSIDKNVYHGNTQIKEEKVMFLLTEASEDALNAVNSIIFGSHGVWFQIGAALVFFMQAGFAMCEAGFTRAKNAGNIIMKNLMDFCLGTVAFILVGYNLLCGVGNNFVGWGLNVFDFDNTDWYGFVFNLVFCATAATIVSGAMAERTKFISYCIYSFVISLFVYPIEAHWVWGGQAWLTNMGFVDFAGSCVIHMVGGFTGLIGAAMLGPRIGKYDKNGKSVPILGHNIVVAALGVFILWFGWYGFNGAAAADGDALGKIFATTTIAPAFATCTAMIFTWIKNGAPDVSMSLNGSLAGLVAITAGCNICRLLTLQKHFDRNIILDPAFAYHFRFKEFVRRMDDCVNGLSKGDSMEKILEEMREKSDRILRTDFLVRGYGTPERVKRNRVEKTERNNRIKR